MAQRVVVIGGSAGSFQGVSRILRELPYGYQHPILLSLHRLKHVRSGFVEALSSRANISVVEPKDKDSIKGGIAYLAPSNYHMFVDLGGKIALSVEPPVHHSRPSIDITFYSVAKVYRERAVGVILSGANRDGAEGIALLKRNGGTALVQNPEECSVRTMTETALQLTEADAVLSIDGIIAYLTRLGAEQP